MLCFVSQFVKKSFRSAVATCTFSLPFPALVCSLFMLSKIPITSSHVETVSSRRYFPISAFAAFAAIDNGFFR